MSASEDRHPGARCDASNYRTGLPVLPMRKLTTQLFCHKFAGRISGCALVLLLANGAVLKSSTLPDSPENPDQLVHEVIHNEVEASLNDHSIWCYRETKQEDSKAEELHEVVGTEQGTVDRLLAISGEPLTPKQQEAEEHRIEQLIGNPELMEEQTLRRHEDDQKTLEMMRMLPNAFHYQYDGMDGDYLKLRFYPNSSFRPPDHEAQVFHHMEGTMLIDPREKRLAGIEGRLTSEVKFGFGLLGHLDKGGTFVVRQAEVGPGHWELVLLNVQMDGKALFFKTIAVRERDELTDFHPLPSNTTLEQALMISKNTERLGETVSADGKEK